MGPQLSMQANFIIRLGDKAHVPIISFSATSPSLASLRSSYFFQAAQKDTSQVRAISSLVEAFGWRQVVPIYVDNEYGEALIPYLTDAMQEVNARVPYRSAIHPAATDDQIALELEKLMNMQIRVFVVHMLSGLGSRIFAKADEIGLMDEGCVWIVTNGLTDFLTSFNTSVISSMQGVLGVKTHVPSTRELRDFRVRWKRQFRLENPTLDDKEVNIFGLWAYDAVFALAMAIEKVFVNSNNNNGSVTGLGSKNMFMRNNTSTSNNSLTDLDTLGVSLNGPKIREELLKVSFRGLAGEFSLVNGQLQSSNYEIVNVIGVGERTVGFWTPQTGLTRKLDLANKTSTTEYSTSKSNLGPIIWPGDSTSLPKGWVNPTTGKKLKIVVPVKSGNSSFVSVRNDPNTNRLQVKGFCIDVFNAVVDTMPYAVPFKFIPFVKPNGESAGSYNDMIDQVYLGKFDAVVADVTIIANRSKYVDFTLPYTDSGVTMIVPIKGMKTKNAWVFLKPLTFDLWATIGCFFVFIGFVVWVLEHRINQDFRGPLSHQIGTSFWFSFSTMVFAHREQVVSNLARFVVTIWCFVVLILTQSYTASLTSLLTVEQLRPTLTDVNELIKTGMKVGFPKGSFVLGMLKEFLPFKRSQIKEYNSLENLGELLENGEIVAAFDEIPYMKLFIAKHCSNYTMVGPTYKTDGFGFVFPRGSPLVGDVSRAILNVTEGDKMKQIENAWFVSDTICPDSSSVVSTASTLGLNSFWGLFLIAGIASLLALTIFLAKFLYEQRQILLRLDSENEASVWRRIKVVLRLFDEKDLSSHTFKKSNCRTSDHGVEITAVDHGSPSPSSYSNQTEFNFYLHEDQPGTSSTQYGETSPN
ncbi:Ionotropic glutamate receptor [Parasponia andersonii]|uniref:Glutamate receptor n=1 Tax=Parasponia andersonii TaxID=3476 RepID=A0A2P5DIP1_PARAD|nr:Ionotropic glutamate receptor [Parasponia andersonii]